MFKQAFVTGFAAVVGGAIGVGVGVTVVIGGVAYVLYKNSDDFREGFNLGFSHKIKRKSKNLASVTDLRPESADVGEVDLNVEGISED